jgi:catechol 2,3-dioxygenase-like lactoylglutathione lyase family enzyme
MKNTLDHIHHIALQVKDIEQSVLWYTSSFSCEVSYRDDSWALLKFDNISLALVLPNQHPPHFAVTRNDITSFGVPVPHRDGTSSVYIQDPNGNYVEMLKLAD